MEDGPKPMSDEDREALEYLGRLNWVISPTRVYQGIKELEAAKAENARLRALLQDAPIQHDVDEEEGDCISHECSGCAWRDRVEVALRVALAP